MEEEYENLAVRNNWKFIMSENKPYFIKNEKYAVPDASTTLEDRELLAKIISEGSIELERLIYLCWDNNIEIGGPCSGITEFHNSTPHFLHFTFIGEKELIEELYKNLVMFLPFISHSSRMQDDKVRYDINYRLNENGLTQRQSNDIFSTVANQLEVLLEKRKTKTKINS